MNDESFIGFWVGRAGQRLHLVESEITDRLVMHCGRQMKLVNDNVAIVLGGPGPRCKQCDTERRS